MMGLAADVALGKNAFVSDVQSMQLRSVLKVRKSDATLCHTTLCTGNIKLAASRFGQSMLFEVLVAQVLQKAKGKAISHELYLPTITQVQFR